MNQTTDEEENALELQFGDVNFRQINCLSHDEMYALFCMRKQGNNIRSEMLEQTMEFLEKVVSSKNERTLLALSETLREYFLNLQLALKSDPSKRSALHQYEMCSLVNFVDDQTRVEEMVSLLPSLDRFVDDDLEYAIRDIALKKAEAAVAV